MWNGALPAAVWPLALCLACGAAEAQPPRPTVSSCAAGLTGSTQWKVTLVLTRPAKAKADAFGVDFGIDNGRTDNRSEDERVSFELAKCVMRALELPLPGEGGGGASHSMSFGVESRPLGFDPAAAGMTPDAPILAFKSTERPSGRDCMTVLPTDRAWTVRTTLLLKRNGGQEPTLQAWSAETDRPAAPAQREKFRGHAYCMIGALALPPARNEVFDVDQTIVVRSAR